MDTTVSPRLAKEMANPALAQQEAAAEIAKCDSAKAKLADLREREALAREALHQCEFSRLTREVAAATRAREEAEFADERKRHWNTAKIVRNADPAIDRCKFLVIDKFHKVRQSGGSHTKPPEWEKLKQATAILRQAIDDVDALKFRYVANVPAELNKILKPLGLTIPPAFQPVSRDDNE